ncbi:MAG: class I SAM-dependent methyltransferase [Mariprofundaceae bacterium]
MSENKKFWNDLSATGKDASVIDPLDNKGHKNKYISMIRNAAIVNKLRSNDQFILDFGCGTGGLTEALNHSGRSVIGIDIASDLLALTKERYYPNTVGFIEYSGFPMPLKDKQFDVITIYAVLVYMKDKEYLKKILLEFHRILKKNGQLIFLEQCRRKTYFDKSGHKAQRSISEYIEIMNESGFDVTDTSIKRYGRFPFIYLIRYGLIPNCLYPTIAKLERMFSIIRGLPYHTDYAETLFCFIKRE